MANESTNSNLIKKIREMSEAKAPLFPSVFHCPLPYVQRASRSLRHCAHSQHLVHKQFFQHAYTLDFKTTPFGSSHLPCKPASAGMSFKTKNLKKEDDSSTNRGFSVGKMHHGTGL